MGATDSKEPSVLYASENDQAREDSDDSGVIKIMDVDSDVLELCAGLKLSHSYLKWATFKIENRTTIVLDEICTTNDQNELKDFLALKKSLIDATEPRYALFNFNTSSEKDYAFIYWCEAGFNVQDKTLYDSNKNMIKQQLGDTIHTEFLASNEASLEYSAYTKSITH